MSQYVIRPGCGETVMIHVPERLDERDSIESFLDIDDVDFPIREDLAGPSVPDVDKITHLP